MKHLLTAALLGAAAAAAQAGDLYTGVGLPGLSVGYAQPLSEHFTLRADFTTIGRLSRSRHEDNLIYRGKLRADRIGLFGDWFPLAGSFRLTGGITLNDARVGLRGSGDGSTITIGRTTYTAGPDDHFDVVAKFPRVMPYVGLGWGRGKAATERGWHVAFDAGIALGKPRVNGAVTGPLLSMRVSPADVERELAELRQDADRIKGIPQLGLALSYRF